MQIFIIRSKKNMIKYLPEIILSDKNQYYYVTNHKYYLIKTNISMSQVISIA